MQYILLIIVLVAAGATGYALGGGFQSFLRDDKFDRKKKIYIDEDPDIQGNMHAEEEE